MFTTSMHRLLLTCSFALLCYSVVDSAKILAIFPSPSYSQYFVGEPLLLHLAERGHEVTLVSFYKPKQPVKNINPIQLDDLKQFNEEPEIMELFNKNIFAAIRSAFAIYHEITTEKLLNDEKVQRLIHSNATFDLVVLEQVANEPLMAFAHHFKAPLAIFSTIGASEWVNHLVANPAPFSYVPHTYTKFSTAMDMWERAQNFLVHSYALYVKYFHLLPRYRETVKKHFPNAPSIEELMYNTSIILLNSHPAATPPYPTTANMIEIGGFHIRQEVLPKDIQESLDKSLSGAVYFSMGTNVDFRDLGENVLSDVIEVLSKLKKTVVWKLADEDLPGKPNNVLIKKWMPQRAILNHTNVRVFISHCGLISTLESVYFGVPLICIPIFADQGMNAALLTDNGVAITIHPPELNKRTLSEALHKILTDKTYSENARQRSQFFKDTPVDPIDLATYWIEFVIRHKGAPHLRNPGLNLRWYQYYYLDLLLLLVASLLLVTFSALFCIRRHLTTTKSKEKQQ